MVSEMVGLKEVVMYIIGEFGLLVHFLMLIRML
jgi:hypothetical protein